ncbi:hypothetical protein CIPAW_14G090500 [Carya illinoinensis]|uniref:Uncharacterized protein n=1 Tax=Carya illinoinensis TaxID=32201 RepID=A0A8T1NID1_CARIL|nr:hypothetical protein CIPAW_14G090500 [Carya illinoinensis]
MKRAVTLKMNDCLLRERESERAPSVCVSTLSQKERDVSGRTPCHVCSTYHVLVSWTLDGSDSLGFLHSRWMIGPLHCTGRLFLNDGHRTSRPFAWRLCHVKLC